MVRADADRLVSRLASNLGAGNGPQSRSEDAPTQLKETGTAHFQAGRLAAAGSFYRSAIQSKPDYAEAHNNLGAVLRRRGKAQSAIAVFQTALMLNPRSGSTLANLANLHERYGNAAQAETFYLKAVELEPTLFQAFLGLARIAAQRQRWDDALAALTRAASIAPQSVEVLYQTGVVNLYKGDLQTAVTMFLNAEGKAPKNAEIKASLAETYFQQDKVQEGEAALAQCFELDPENALGLTVKNSQDKRVAKKSGSDQDT